MPSIQLSDDAAEKIRAFGRIIDAILGSENSPKTESRRTELVVSVGLDHMLRDVLPKEEMLLNTMTQMFNLNPEFVCQFVADAIKEGREEQTKQADDARKRWGLYA